MKKLILKTGILLATIGIFGVFGENTAEASTITDFNTNEKRDIIVTDENGNIIEDIELTVEKTNPLTRGFSLSKKVSIGVSNATGIFAKSLNYKETGNKNMMVQYSGTIYYHSASWTKNHQYTLYTAVYKGTVYGWTN